MLSSPSGKTCPHSSVLPGSTFPDRQHTDTMPPPLRHRAVRIFMNDDRHVMAKHSAVYPTQQELEAVQNMVSHTERALKSVSDWLDEQEKVTGKPDFDGAEAEKESEHKGMEQATRSLRGVMRVGLVAKGLLLKGDLELELVLLCKDKPTVSLLKKVADNLAVQLKAITEDKYVVTQSVKDATIVIKSSKEPPLSLTIHMTSPLVREDVEKAAAGGRFPHRGGDLASAPLRQADQTAGRGPG